MNGEEVIRIYDEQYAELYDGRFLLGPGFAECTTYEIGLLDALLKTARSWLDVACGTGYFLSQFPGIERCGLDISPGMLARARRANAEVTLVEGDYRDDMPQWHGRWEVVSSMWYAYCYASSVRGVEKVVRNMIQWTAPGGTCFLPVCDPDVLSKTRLPYRPPADSKDGRLEITAVIWNWIDEPPGRQHIGLVAPLIQHMRELFMPFFGRVEVIAYPAFKDDCLAARNAIIATGRHGN